jgi:hypothetical protein
MDHRSAIASILPRVERLIGAPVTAWREAGGGYTPAIRLVCATARRSVFVKAGSTPLTAGFLRREIAFYASARGAFLPVHLASEDHEHHPLLVLEDLSAARWPPPWDARMVDLVLHGIDDIHAGDGDVPRFAEDASGWAEVARDRAPLLALGLADPGWVDRALPRLVAAEAACVTAGDALCHFDLRSDNLCVVRDRAVFIDWACACRADPRLDVGFWLPSLAAEGGPPPDAILPDAPEIAAWVSGFFAARAGQPMIPDAPRVREVQRRQLVTALPWVARALGLPPPR